VNEKTQIPPPDWEALIEQIAEDIITVHTPQRILEVRSKLYDLLSHCIPATMVLKTLTFKLVAHREVDADLKLDIVKWAAFYEHRIRNGSVSSVSRVCKNKIS
jgi:replication factor C subunit 3/5